MPSFPDGMTSALFQPDFTCVNRVVGDNSCEDYVAYVPDGTQEQPELFLFLPGLGSMPSRTAHIPVIAAYAGHKALSISWDNQSFVAARCTDVALGYLGGVCADNCSSNVRYEMLNGVDNPATPIDSTFFGIPLGYEGRYLSSITQRTARALEYLHAQDMLDNTPRIAQVDAPATA